VAGEKYSRHYSSASPLENPSRGRGNYATPADPCCPGEGVVNEFSVVVVVVVVVVISQS